MASAILGKALITDKCKLWTHSFTLLAWDSAGCGCYRCMPEYFISSIRNVLPGDSQFLDGNSLLMSSCTQWFFQHPVHRLCHSLPTDSSHGHGENKSFVFSPDTQTSRSWSHECGEIKIFRIFSAQTSVMDMGEIKIVCIFSGYPVFQEAEIMNLRKITYFVSSS
jgi:hypothetical protein